MTHFEPESVPGKFLASFREEMEPSTDQLQSIGDRIAARHAAGDAGLDFDSLPDPGPASLGAAKLGLVGKAVLAAVGSAALGAAALSQIASPGAEPGPTVQAQPAVVQPIAEPEPTVPPAVQFTATPGTDQDARPDPATPAKAPPSDDAEKRIDRNPSTNSRRPASKGHRRSHSVTGEVDLYKRAQKALRMGNPRKALGLIRTLEREYPKGLFATEREILHAEALCATGKKKAARTRAARFIASHRGSPLVTRARGICQEP